MRLGTVIGRVTLTQKEPAYTGGRLLIVQPLSREQFGASSENVGMTAPALPLAHGVSVVVYDELGAQDGSIVGFTEGAEAAQPFTGDAPVDAYNACIVQHIDYRPPPARPTP